MSLQRKLSKLLASLPAYWLILIVATCYQQDCAYNIEPVGTTVTMEVCTCAKLRFYIDLSQNSEAERKQMFWDFICSLLYLHRAAVINSVSISTL